MLFVINYTPVARDDYRVGVPKRKQYKLILNSKEPEFGGDVHKEVVDYKAVKKNVTEDHFPLHIHYRPMELQYSDFKP